MSTPAPKHPHEIAFSQRRPVDGQRIGVRLPGRAKWLTGTYSAPDHVMLPNGERVCVNGAVTKSSWIPLGAQR